MRDTKLLQTYHAKQMRENKEKQLQRMLRKEVETGASGTQKYRIKAGTNAGKIAEGFQKSQS
tara:strand:- start:644 stop:829 length:186 start_codon:yes stop_codon:yes gene_type:complete